MQPTFLSMFPQVCKCGIINNQKSQKMTQMKPLTSCEEYPFVLVVHVMQCISKHTLCSMSRKTVMPF